MRRVIRSLLALTSCVALSACGSSIHDNVASGDLEAVETILSTDADRINEANDLGKTPLHYAVNFAQQEVMVHLIESGARIDAQDNTGLTPLHIAAIIDLPGAARLLAKEGASLEIEDDFGRTPLRLAELHGSERVYDYLNTISDADIE